MRNTENITISVPVGMKKELAKIAKERCTTISGYLLNDMKLCESSEAIVDSLASDLRVAKSELVACALHSFNELNTSDIINALAAYKRKEIEKWANLDD